MRRRLYPLFLRLFKLNLALRQWLFQLYLGRRKSQLAHADLSFLNLSGSNLHHADLRSANLIRSDLSNTNLSHANLTNADLSGARLFGADLRHANLTGAVVSVAQLATAAALEGMILPGGETYDGRLPQPEPARAGLPAVRDEALGAFHVVKRGQNLRGADLTAVEWPQADLRWSDFSEATLLDANLNGANLMGASLENAMLQGADLRGANLLAATLRGANLREANLHGALVIEEQFADVASLTDAILPDGTQQVAGGAP